MQHDEMIWQVINHQFCSYKTKIGVALSDKSTFCRHPYSVTGLCNRSSCPLANSRYATIREEDGRVNLYLKTVERAHSPKNLWEKITLSRNYSRALAQLDEHLAYMPKALVHRNKQRLTKIHQYLIRMRKIKLKELGGKKAKMVSINRKIDQREERREKKALVAAKLEQSIEKELVERLARGTYGDIYNFPEAPYQKALAAAEEQEMESEEESEEEMEEDDEGLVEYVEDLEEGEEEDDMEDMEYAGNGQWEHGDDSESSSDEESEDDTSEDDDDSESSSSSEDEEGMKKKRKLGKKMQPKKPRQPRGPRVEIEYEEETETESTAMQSVQKESVAGSAW
jgi:protein MAK16